MKQVWAYAARHNLKESGTIKCDARLRDVFGVPILDFSSLSRCVGCTQRMQIELERVLWFHTAGNKFLSYHAYAARCFLRVTLRFCYCHVEVL